MVYPDIGPVASPMNTGSFTKLTRIPSILHHSDIAIDTDLLLPPSGMHRHTTTPLKHFRKTPLNMPGFVAFPASPNYKKDRG